MRPPGIEMLYGWGLATRGTSLVYRPRSSDDVAAAVADAAGRGLSVAARGAGLSYGDAALNQGGAVLDLSRMNKVLDFDAESGLIRVEAGATIEDLWKTGLPHGWWPPVVPGTMKATVGGCVAMNIHGKNHVSTGAFGRHVQSVTLVTGSGELRTLSRGTVPDSSAGAADTANPELWSLSLHDVIGSMGLTGTMAEITIQLRRVHSGFLEVEGLSTPSLPETMMALDQGAEGADYSVAWIDCMGLRAGRGAIHNGWHLPTDHARAGVGMAVEDQSLPSRIAGLLPKHQAWRALRPLTNRWGMRLLNSAKYRAGAVRRQHRYLQSHAAFHFLLDYVPDWKRAYGPGGLMQYQLFIPRESAREAFADALHLQRKLGVPSYLGVMKRHTPEDSAATYCLDGYSLALDFPVERGPRFGRMMRLFRSLDRIVHESGGRIYGAKDAVGTGLLPGRREAAFSSSLVRRWEQWGGSAG